MRPGRTPQIAKKLLCSDIVTQIPENKPAASWAGHSRFALLSFEKQIRSLVFYEGLVCHLRGGWASLRFHTIEILQNQVILFVPLQSAIRFEFKSRSFPFTCRTRRLPFCDLKFLWFTAARFCSFIGTFFSSLRTCLSYTAFSGRSNTK